MLLLWNAIKSCIKTKGHWAHSFAILLLFVWVCLVNGYLCSLVLIICLGEYSCANGCFQCNKNCVVSFGKVSWIAQLRILEKQKNEHKKQQQQESDGQKEGNEQKKQAKTNAIAIWAKSEFQLNDVEWRRWWWKGLTLMNCSSNELNKQLQYENCNKT